MVLAKLETEERCPVAKKRAAHAGSERQHAFAARALRNAQAIDDRIVQTRTGTPNACPSSFSRSKPVQ